MKKNRITLILVVVCIATLCATIFAGCKGVTMPEDIKYDNGMFSWNAVAGADGYMVSVNDSSNEVYVDTALISAFDARLKDDLVDKEVNILKVRAVTLDKDGNVKKSSKTAEYEFDYATPVETAWTVTFDLNYANAPQASTITVKSGDKFDKPTPIRPGWTLAGWYRDSQCLVAFSFTPSGKSISNVTADITLYAKWTASEPVSTTAIYFYSETWTQVAVKPYKGETALFTGEGIPMAAAAGKANWYKADIVDTATNVIFTDGTDSTDSLTFNKATPYYKDGVWTATMPVDTPDEPETVVTITVGSGSPQQLTENPEVAGEYMIDVDLEVGDSVVITMDGKAVSNYDKTCKFTGTATIQGKHSFYVTVERIWVEMPEAPSIVFLIINDDAENAKGMKEHPCDDKTVEIQYAVTVTLKAGDTVKIVEGNTEFKFDTQCGFDGTAASDGEYTFYAKKYIASAENDPDVWVTIPSIVPTTSTTIYYYNNGWNDNWSQVFLYCWNSATEEKPAAWPGVEMTALGGGWFVLEIQPGYDRIIFSGAEGNQTGNLILTPVDGVAYYNYNGVTNDRPAE